MMQLKVDGVRFNLDKKTKRYVRRKIGRLDRFIPKSDRNGLHAQVTLIENFSQPNEHYVCEIKLHIRPRDLFVKESTVVSMHTAIDQAEATLQRQLGKFKSQKLNSRQQARRFANRVKRFGRM